MSVDHSECPLKEYLYDASVVEGNTAPNLKEDLEQRFLTPRKELIVHTKI